MMKTILDAAFSNSPSKSDKDFAKHLRTTLIKTHGTYASVIFDIQGLTMSLEIKGTIEMAFLIGLQAGYELGIEFPPTTK